MKKLILITLILTAGGIGCTSLSTLQGARTTKKGELTHTFAAGSYATEVTASGSSGAEGTVGEAIQLPMLEYMLRYGVTDSFDFGLKSSGTSNGADIKYNLMDGSFALALGLGVNMVEFTTTVSVSGSGSAESSTKITDYIVPVYMNFDMGGGSMYLVPKLIAKTISKNGVDENLSQKGITLGYQFNKEKGFFLEYNMVTWSEDVSGTSKSYTIAQPALGYVW